MLKLIMSMIKRDKVMSDTPMTKLYWFDTELDKVLKQGYNQGEALQIVLDRLATMDSIEWLEPRDKVMSDTPIYDQLEREYFKKHGVSIIS